MTDLDKSLISRERHDQDREFHNCRLFMLLDVDLLNGKFFLSLSFLLNFFQKLHNLDPFLRIVIQISCKLFLLLLQFFNLFLEKLGQFLLASVMFINKPVLNDIEDPIELICTFLVATEQLLFDIGIVGFISFKSLPIFI